MERYKNCVPSLQKVTHVTTLPSHVYDVTYECIKPYQDSLVIIDDSIVRGTTLKESILRILDRLHPKKIVVVSSAPQIRFPDYYGIDMPHSRRSSVCSVL